MVTSSAGLKLADTTPSTGTDELRRLSTLLDISQALAAGTNQKSALQHVLAILDRHAASFAAPFRCYSAGGEIEVVASEGAAGPKADVRSNSEKA